jgi:hypothetical protein
MTTFAFGFRKLFKGRLYIRLNEKSSFSSAEAQNIWAWDNG